jgi:hypothetical protein
MNTNQEAPLTIWKKTKDNVVPYMLDKEMKFVEVLYPGYRSPLVTAQQPEHDRLYQQPNGRSQAPSVKDVPATPKPARREGATYLKGILRRCEPCCMGPWSPLSITFLHRAVVMRLTTL